MHLAIVREYNWEMGHVLATHPGKCHNPHGHNYKLEVEVSRKNGEPVSSPSGMVMDFSTLDVFVKPVLEDYDHQFLVNEADDRLAEEDINILIHDGADRWNFTRVSWEPTAEQIVLTIWKQLTASQRSLPDYIYLDRLTLYETDKASATIRRS